LEGGQRLSRARAAAARLRALAVVFAFAIFLGSAAAQTIDAAHDPSAFGDRTPRGAAARYLRLAREVNYRSAAALLDLSGIPEPERAEQGPILARRLKVVLDRNFWIDLESLSDHPDGVSNDGLPQDTDRVGTFPSQRGPVDVMLRRVPDATGAPVWRFSASLVERIPDLYDEFGAGWLGDHVPARLQRMRVLGLEAWQAIALFLLVPLTWLAGWAGSRLLARVVEPIVKRTRTPLDDRILVTMRRPQRWAVAIVALTLAIRALHLSVQASKWVDRVLVGLAFVTAIVLVGAVVEAFAQTTRERLVREGHLSGAGVVGVVNRIVRALLACIALIGVLQALGFNVTGLLAGLGIGGLALALAAQKTVENLIGGLMLMTDQPVKIGDFCRFGDKTGWVEDIGFRSTRIRTLERSVVSVPNAEFANIQIENLASRDRIRFFATINLRFETTADQLRGLLVDLRGLFIGHPRIANDPLRIRFIGFGASSLDVEIQSYVMTADPNEFFAIREDILLRIMDVVAANGTGFAFPSQTLYMAKDGGVEPEKTRASEGRIRAMRADHTLPFPDFAPQQAQELSDRLDYPPDGSSGRTSR
jgi:MscS family membrane protein